MTSILEQFETTEEIKIPTTVEKKKTKKKITPTTSAEVEEKREQLSILAVLGTIEEYTGVKLSLGDVKKLSPADVEKYHNRYQVKMGTMVSGSLVNMTLEGTSEVLNYFLPIDDKKELCTDLKKNELLKQELNSVAGYTILKGGRFVALGSGLLQVVKHLKFSSAAVKQSSDSVEQTIQDS